MGDNTANNLTTADVSSANQMVIDASKIPALVELQFRKLVKLDNSVNKAIRKASDAEKAAEKAGNCSKDIFHRKAALETISGAVDALSEANRDNAQGLAETFKFMQSLAEINQGLFGLAAMSMAANSTVLQQLELKLQGASKEKLSKLAQSELKRTIDILKSQKSIHVEQEKLKNRAEAVQLQLKALQNEADKRDDEQDIRLSAGEEKDRQQDAALKQQAIKDVEHDNRLKAGEQKDAEQDARMEAGEEKDRQQDARIEANMAQDAQQDRLIAENMEQDARQDQQLARHSEKDAVHDAQIAALQEENRLLRTDLEAIRTLLKEKTEKQFSIMTLSIAGAALIASGIQFLL